MNKHIPKEWCRKCSCLCSQFQTTSYFVFSDGSWGCLFHSVFPFENSFKTQATTTGFTKWRKIKCLLLIYNLPFAQNSFCVIVSLFRQWEGCLNVFYRSFSKTTGYCRGAIFKKNFKIEDTFTTFFTITFCFKFRFPTTLLFMYLVSLKSHFQTLTISPSLDACCPTSKCSYQLTLTLIMQNTIFHSVM